MSGVERWATEVIPRLWALAPDRYLTLMPPPVLRGRARGQAWEQLVLPALAARARASLLFSPANLAPRLWPRNVMVVHDTAVLREPAAYSRAYRAWHGRFEVACARHALKVITVSEFSRGELVELAAVDPEQIAVIPGGVDGRFHPNVEHEAVARKHGLQGPYVLSVGTDDLRKNLATLAMTVPALRRAGIELVKAGGTRSHLTGERSLKGLRSLGYVDDDDLPGLYAGASAFVLPSRYEGFGLPCLEAMACGTPVVASDRTAIPEACGGAALLVDPDDAPAMAEAVMRAATDEQLRAQLREAGLRRAAVMTWDRTARAVDDLLSTLVDR